MITRIAFYDFDGTLFRSPDSPKGWDPAKWFTSIDSLSPPYVPEMPSNKWWVAPVVAHMKKDIKDLSCFTTVITGRERHTYEDRVVGLLASKGITPDIIYLREEVNKRLFKKNCLGELLKMFPNVQSIRGWEDNSDDLAEFKTFVESQKGSNFQKSKGVSFEAVYVPRQRSP